MKMAKKLLALVLTGVMAMSVLTGCGSTASRQAAGKLEGMLKEANPNATVEVGAVKNWQIRLSRLQRLMTANSRLTQKRISKLL